MKKFLLFFTLFIISIVIFLYLLRQNPSYLTHNAPVDANILVVEGWMPHYGLHKAYMEFMGGEYDYLVVTGNKKQGNLTMYINSYLIFYPHDTVYSENDSDYQLFDLDISSTLGDKDSAHFVLWVNDQRITEHYTTEQRGRFGIIWEGKISDIDSVMIQYTNDMVSEAGDRNLSINKLNLNGYSLLIDYADLYLDRGRPFGRYRRNVTATSYSELAAHFFVNSGIDKDKVIAVTNDRLNLRFTYGNALSFKEWIHENPIEINGINIVSMDYHSRRTWLIFNKLVGGDTEVGILSATDYPTIHSRKIRYYKILRESVALIYYYIFILPWV